VKKIIVLIFALCMLSFKAGKKKETFLSICKVYSPDNYSLLQYFPETSINHLSERIYLKDYIFNFPFIIHEAAHYYNQAINIDQDTIRKFRINDSLTFSIKQFNSFASIELNKYIGRTDRDKVFRYDTYINNKDRNYGTQKNGFLGLLEEVTAYYQEFKAYLEFYYYLENEYGWTSPEIWFTYLTKLSSVTYSINEFKLFISWYLQYSEFRYPLVHDRIISNKTIQELYTFIHNENEKLLLDFERKKSDIFMQLGSKIIFKDDFISIPGVSAGASIQQKKAQEIMAILNKKEHLILNKLLIIN